MEVLTIIWEHHHQNEARNHRWPTYAGRPWISRSQQILRVVFALFRDPAAAEVAVHALVEATATSLWNMDEEELSDGVKHLAGAPLRVAG